ncbi:MAG TPA: YceI family protein, partial [Kofleriaceae bacterium]|nr:YceI family protein [Kofleriaceae bacterium]
MKYRVSSGKLTVTARSKLHDTTTVWDKLSGEVDAEADSLATSGAKATFTVDMTAFDAGGFMKNRALKKDFDFDAHPKATFELRDVRDVVRDGPTFKATAEGVLRWRGRDVVVTVQGQGKLDAAGLEARGTFELDIRSVGLQAPRMLVIKMDDIVT